MNLQQLEYFKTVAEVENFTAASKVLAVTQPALSKSISHLEEELNVCLFEKQGRNIRLTKYGQAFLTYACNALEEIEHGVDTLARMRLQDQDTLSIITDDSLGFTLLPSLLRSFLDMNTDIKLNVSYVPADAVLSNVISNNADFGFVYCLTPLDHLDEFTYYPVSTTEYFACTKQCTPTPAAQRFLTFFTSNK